MMKETITVAEYHALLKTKQPRQAPKQKQESDLVQQFNAVLIPYGWRCGEARLLCDDARSIPPAKRKGAMMNALVMWRTDSAYCAQRVRFVGWLWEVTGWSDAQIAALVERQVSV